MNRTYLEIAEATLHDAGRPLSADAIALHADKLGLLDVSSRTPAASFRARLSIDLRRNGFHSKFQRVRPGRFALRQWGLHEYIAPALTRQIPDEIVTCVATDDVSPPASADVFVPTDTFRFTSELRDKKRLVFVPRPEAETRDDVRQLIVYVVLRQGSLTLTYRRGHFSSVHEMLRGALCLGFGGHIQMHDSRDLFGLHDVGVSTAAAREIHEELDGLTGLTLEPVGLINDRTSPEGIRHLGIVVAASLPSDFTEDRSKRERAINDLRLMSAADLVARYHELEFWSQLVVKHVLSSRETVSRCIVRPTRVARGTTVVAVVGEIAVGKTTLCEMMVGRLGFSRVSTRDCVAHLIGMTDFGAGRRAEFQSRAQELITSPGGFGALAGEIARRVSEQSKPVVVDGIRHLRTYQLLLERCESPVTLLYVDTSRDLAVRNYISRAQFPATVDDFRMARFHEVEAEIPLLKQEADAYVFNGGTTEQLFEGVRDWFSD